MLFSGHTSLISFFLTLLCTSQLVSAQNGDGGSASGVQPGDIGYDPSATGSADAGAGGKDTGSVNLSKGATIAIAVVVAIVVILGVTSAVLFYLAKKRQWKIRASLRRTTRRVATGLTQIMTPRSPRKMSFSPIEKTREGSEGMDLLKENTKQNSTSPSDQDQPPKPFAKDNNKGKSKVVSIAPPTTTTTTTTAGSARDVEKGLLPPIDTQMGENRPTKKVVERKPLRPIPPHIQTRPQSSVSVESPKTPIWSKVFGR